MRIVTSVLAVMLLLGLAVSGTAQQKADPLGKEPQLITLTRGAGSDPNQKFPEGQTFEDNAYTRMLTDKFNIQVKYDFVAADYNQQVNLTIASGSLPDYLANISYTQYRATVKAGLVMDIKSVWDAYASDKTKEVYASNKALFDGLVLKDGKMYAIPGSNPTCDFLSVLWIRKDWLDKLNLKAPTNLAELKAVAKAFITKNADGHGDTVGIVGPPVNGHLYQEMQDVNFAYHFDQVFATFGSFPGIWVKDSKGQPAYGSILPQTKSALAELASMYKDGLISPEMLTGQTDQLVGSNRAGIFFGPWWFPFGDISASWKNDPAANWQPYSLASGSDGIYQAKGGNAAAYFTVINKKCQNPQAVVKMLNIFKAGLKNYVPEADQTIMGDGVFPMYMTFSLAYGPAMVRQELLNYYAGKKTKEQVNAYFDNYDAYQNQAFDKIVAAKTKPYSNENISGWDFSGDKANEFGWVWSFGIGLRPYVEGKFKWVNSLTYLVTPTMEKSWANLLKREYETFSKIILGQAPISDFDAFVTRWKNEGGDVITREIADSLK